jgi:hypothetical protein
VYSSDNNNNDDDVVSLTSLASSLSSLSIVLSSLSIVLAEKRKTARATFTRFRFRRDDSSLAAMTCTILATISFFSGLMGVLSPKVLRVHCHISAKVASLGRYFRLCCMARTVISYCSFHTFQTPRWTCWTESIACVVWSWQNRFGSWYLVLYDTIIQRYERLQTSSADG